MRILVDIDEVLAEWGAEYDKQLDKVDPLHEIPRTPHQHVFDLSLGRTENELSKILTAMRVPGFYANLKPVRGAKEALKTLEDLGHSVHLVSSPFPSNPTCASDKFDWVKKVFGEKWVSRTVLTQDKTVVSGDILIDDKPEVTGSMTPEWEHIVFDAVWNKSVTTKRRLRSWGTLQADIPEIWK